MKQYLKSVQSKTTNTAELFFKFYFFYLEVHVFIHFSRHDDTFDLYHIKS